MGKQVWKPGNMLYPLPVVMVSVRDRDGQYHYRGMGRNGLHQSADGIHFRASGASFLPNDKGKRRICDQSGNGAVSKGC